MRVSIVLFLIGLFVIPCKEKPSFEVFIFLHDECLITQYYTLTLDSLYQEFSSDNIKFVGVFPNEITSQDDIEEFKNKYGLQFEMVKDEHQEITKKLGATLTPEVFVVNQESKEIIYKGRIDDSYFRVGKRRTVTTTSELEDVLNSIKEGEEITTESVTSIGCFIQRI